MDKAERAESLFAGGCNCAQAVFTAFADEFGMDEALARRVACGLGGGVGRMRETCGAVTGAALVLGMRHGPDKAAAYPVIQDFCAKFKAKAGSIVCRELLAGTGATTGGAPEARTPEYYGKRPCSALVKLAASLLLPVAAGCWSFCETPFPQTQPTSAAPAATNLTLTVAGFESVLTEYEAIYGYTTVYVPARYGRRHFHPGYYDTVQTCTMLPQRRSSDMFLVRAKEQFERAGFLLGTTVSDCTVEVTFAGPMVEQSDIGWSLAWMVGTAFFCDYTGAGWTAKLNIRDTRTGRLIFHHDYEQRFETHTFGLIPLFGPLSCDRSSPAHIQSWCLAALTDRAVADATAFLAGAVK